MTSFDLKAFVCIFTDMDPFLAGIDEGDTIYEISLVHETVIVNNAE